MKWLEKKLKSRLTNKASDFDMDSMWSEIENKRFPRKKRRFPIWIIFSLLGVISVGGFLIYNDFYSSSDIVELAVGDSKNPMQADSEAAISPVSIISTEESIESKKDRKFKENVEELSKTKNILEVEKVVMLDKSTSTLMENKDLNAIIGIEKNESNELPIKYAIDFSDTLENTNNTNNKNQLQVEKLNDLVIAGLESKTISISDVYFKSKDLELLKNNNIGSGDYNKSSLLLAFNYGFMDNNLQTKNPGQNVEGYVRRKEAEQVMNGLGVSLYYVRPLSTNFHVTIGLSYQSYLMKYSYQFSEITQSTKQDTTVLAFNADGSSTVTIEEVPVSKTEEFLEKRFLEFNSVRLPLLLGYNTSLDNKWTFSVASGVSYSLYLDNMGKIFNDNKSINSYETLLEAGYTTSNHWSGITKLGVARNIFENWSLNANVILQYDFSSRTTASSNYLDRMNSIGVELGISRHF